MMPLGQCLDSRVLASVLEMRIEFLKHKHFFNEKSSSKRTFFLSTKVISFSKKKILKIKINFFQNKFLGHFSSINWNLNSFHYHLEYSKKNSSSINKQSSNLKKRT